MRGIRAAMGMLMLVLTGAAFAAELTQPYRVERPVADQNPETRNRIAREGLRELLQRLSGHKPDDAAVAGILGRAPNMVQSFGFREPTAEERALGAGLYVLQLDFEPNAVNRALRDAGLPQWGRERPRTMLWLAEPAAGEQAPGFLGESGDTLKLAHLRLAADRRGLPLILPRNDETDVAALSVSDIEPVMPEKVVAASQRYGADAILVGTLSQTNGAWTGHLALMQEPEPLVWDVSGASEDAVLAAALDGLGERLAEKYAVSAAQNASSGPIPLDVGNVRSVNDYGQVLRYLQSLSQVQQVAVLGVDGTVLHLRVTAVGDAESLRQLFALGSKLQPSNAPANAVLPTGDASTPPVAPVPSGLDYQWVP